MKILSDDEFFEGVLGGFSFLVANHIFQKQEKHRGNLIVIIIVSWACFWYIRKMGMNLYKQHKNINLGAISYILGCLKIFFGK